MSSLSGVGFKMEFQHVITILATFFYLIYCVFSSSVSNSSDRFSSFVGLDFVHEKDETKVSWLQSETTIYFNNPQLLKDQKGKTLSFGAFKNDSKTNQATVETIGGVYLAVEAFSIGKHLKKMANEELGVTIMQSVFDSLPFVPAALKEDEVVAEMAARMKSKLQKYTNILERTKNNIEKLYSAHMESLLCHTNLCCPPWSSKTQLNEQLSKDYAKSASCDSITQNAFCPGPNLTHIFEENLREIPTIKWQYFISPEGALIHYPPLFVDPLETCKDVDNGRHREVFVSTSSPSTKFVVIVIDHGNSLSLKQLTIAKAVTKYIVSLLSHNDVVGLIGLDSEVSFPQINNCFSKQMVDATLENKLTFYRFIDNLMKAKEATNHSLGFEKAFEMLKDTLNFRNVTTLDSTLIIYVSRGFLYSLPEARTVMETIANRNQEFDDKVTINTYAVIDDSKTIIYEKKFMQDLANQNYSKYLPSLSHRKPKQGLNGSVNSTHNLNSAIGNPFSVLNLPLVAEPTFSLIHWDSHGKGLIMTISILCLHTEQPIGVVAIDMHMDDIMEDATFFNHAGKTYVFIVDSKGYVVYHPLFIRANPMIEQPIHTDISQLETKSGFHSVWAKMEKLPKGVEMLVISSINNSSPVKHIKYSWMKVENSPYIICMVNENPNDDVRVLKNSEVATLNSITYHKLELVPEVKKCRHLKQQATIKAAGFYLSPSCFISPFEYLSREESRGHVQGYMAYISDNTKLIANPGLKSYVRGDVAALMHIASQWKKKFLDSALSPYVVRRYMATVRGVLLMYPGASMEKIYNPTKRPWFSKALMYPGQVVMSAPYLDIGGAGYIVTLSHTVYQGSPSSTHTSSDEVVAVLALDLTLGYLEKLVYEAMPVCNKDKVSCFIFDDNGYLLLHPDLVEPYGRSPTEQQHLTHKEPLVANDVANHKGFVTKKLCNSFSDRTVQRFYQFNSSVEETLTNLVHGEHCAKYQIVTIPGTNLFLGIVNQTCDTVTAFCPCSMVDRLCLNCHRMEQSECECPCECPLQLDLCAGKLMEYEDLNPNCFHLPDEISFYDSDKNVLENLEACVEISCEQRTKSDCVGVVGCEWCEVDVDGEMPMAQPFCVEQRRCFGGMLGARSPYSDEIVGLPSEEYLSIKSSPVGPVAGGIMGCFLVLALAIYCYKHHVHRSHSHHFMSSAPDMQVRMSQMDDVDDTEIMDDQGAGHSNVVLAVFDNSISISPYRMNTGYRRPTGGDSDHGYSTMTPHEDSEHMPYAEPLLVGKDRYRLPPLQSITAGEGSRTSSPVPKPLINLTVIPSPASAPAPFTTTTELRPHHVLASVQVHMVDSH